MSKQAPSVTINNLVLIRARFADHNGGHDSVYFTTKGDVMKFIKGLVKLHVTKRQNPYSKGGAVPITYIHTEEFDDCPSYQTWWTSKNLHADQHAAFLVSPTTKKQFMFHHYLQRQGVLDNDFKLVDDWERRFNLPNSTNNPTTNTAALV